MSMVFFPFFGIWYLAFLACSLVKNLDIFHLFWASCVSRICNFLLCLFLSMDVTTDDSNVVFGNVSNKGRCLVTEGDDVPLIIGETVGREDYCAGVTIK